MTDNSSAIAEARRLAPLVRRDPEGWDSPVNVQEWAPNTPTYAWDNAGRVDHCGLSLNVVLFNIGLTMGVHFGNLAWTPSGYQWLAAAGRAVDLGDVEPGDIVFFSNSGSIDAITHVGMATDYAADDGGIRTIEFNTDPTGQGREYLRYPGYMVAAGRPAYAAVATIDDPPPAFVPTTNLGAIIRWCIDVMGFTPAGAAGVAGNFQAESACDPEATENNVGIGGLAKVSASGVKSAGYGIAQWSFDRLWGPSGIFEFARRDGRSSDDLELQLDFTEYEFDLYPDFVALAERLHVATDPWDAAQDFGATFERFAIEGLRNSFAVEIYARIMAGEFGPTTIQQVTPNLNGFAGIAAILDDTFPGALMSAIFIDLVGDVPEGCPRTWANLGLGFKPVRGTEPNRNQPAITNLSLSWADAGPHLAQSFVTFEDRIDGQPDLAARRIRNEAARQVLIAAKVDPDKVAAG